MFNWLFGGLDYDKTIADIELHLVEKKEEIKELEQQLNQAILDKEKATRKVKK